MKPYKTNKSPGTPLQAYPKCDNIPPDRRLAIWVSKCRILSPRHKYKDRKLPQMFGEKPEHRFKI